VPACLCRCACCFSSTAPKQTCKHDTRNHETRKHGLTCLLVCTGVQAASQARRPSRHASMTRAIMRHASMTLRACLLVQVCNLLLKSTAPKQTRKHDTRKHDTRKQDLTCLLVCTGVRAASQARRPSRHANMTRASMRHASMNLHVCLFVQVCKLLLKHGAQADASMSLPLTMAASGRAQCPIYNESVRFCGIFRAPKLWFGLVHIVISTFARYIYLLRFVCCILFAAFCLLHLFAAFVCCILFATFCCCILFATFCLLHFFRYDLFATLLLLCSSTPVAICLPRAGIFIACIVHIPVYVLRFIYCLAVGDGAAQIK